MQNLRDVGGHVTRDGERLRTGVLFRGDTPAASYLTGLGLRTIVDLRWGRERERRPYETAWFGGRLVNVPLVEEPYPIENGFGPFNRWLLETRGAAFAEIVSILAEADSLPALLHCSAGKDRTGVLTALIQSWLGVPDDVVAADYALSAELLRADTEEAIEKQKLALGVDARKRPELLEARPEWILGALEALRGAHGDPERYLIAQGVAPDDLRRLRAALVEP